MASVSLFCEYEYAGVKFFVLVIASLAIANFFKGGHFLLFRGGDVTKTGYY